MARRIGRYTIGFDNQPAVVGYGSAVGKKESEGPLCDWFDHKFTDTKMGEDTWEAAESDLMKTAVQTALDRANVTSGEIDGIFAGDLLDQCIASAFGLRKFDAQHIGLFGACSTMALSLGLASIAVESGAMNTAVATTSSHFCSAERQFRFPLEYGGKRTPTSQWTVTGSGALVLKKAEESTAQHDTAQNYTAHIKSVTFGRMLDYDITDANNMGAAMAPAAADTIYRHLSDTGSKPNDYDMILTGDLGQVGGKLLKELLIKKGVDITEKYNDCGCMIFDLTDTDIAAGGSGCGCSGSVLCSYIMKRFEKGELNRILFCATGALMSPTSSQQGLSIPGVAHAVEIVR